MKNDLSQEELKKVLSYDPATGVFRWAVPMLRNKIKAGDIAGSYDPDGYICITYRKYNYKSHRLAFLYMEGFFPGSKEQIDHINGIRDDNSFLNLRIVSCQENCQNRIEHRKNGQLPGAFFRRKSGRWLSQITIDGKHYHLGTWATKEEANLAYRTVFESRDPITFRKNIRIRKNVPQFTK